MLTRPLNNRPLTNIKNNICLTVIHYFHSLLDEFTMSFEFTNLKLKIMKIHQSSKCILSFLAKLKIQFCVFEIFECFIQWERCVSWQISVSIIFKNQIQNCSAMKTDSGPLRNFKNFGSRKFFDGSIENYFNIKYIYNFLVCLHFIQIYAQRDIAIFDIYSHDVINMWPTFTQMMTHSTVHKPGILKKLRTLTQRKKSNRLNWDGD